MAKIKLEDIKRKFLSEPGSRHLNREMIVDPKTIDKDKYYAEFSVSSETPVLRWFGYEILDHSTSSIRTGRLSDGAAHRDGHYGDQIGIVEKWWLDETERKLRVGVRFSQNTARAIEIFKDICDGIRKNVSIDYDIHEIRFEKEVDEVCYYRITDWEPIHTCNTPDGADGSVGIGRSKDGEPVIIPINAENEDINTAIEKFNRENGSNYKILINQKRSNAMTEEEKKALEEAQKAALKDAREKDAARAKGIRMMAQDLKRNVQHIDLAEKAEEYIQQDKSELDFYNFCREEMKKPEATRTPEAHLDIPESDLKKVNLGRAIMACADGTIDKLGIEREISEELKKSLKVSSRGLILPTNVIDAKGKRARQQRAYQNVSDPGAGGNTVNQQVIAESFIEYLTNTLISVLAGVTFMPGMSGEVPFIRELDELVAGFVAESGHATGSGITYSRVTSNPKQISAKTSMSRQMLLQSPHVNEPYIQRKLYGAIKRVLDRAIWYGTGAGNQPLGIKNITGVHGTLGQGFTRDKAISMKSSIRTDNAEVGGVSWLSNPVTAGVLQGKMIAQNYPAFLLNDDNVMLARKLFESNQIDEGDLFYGVFSTVYLLEWGYIDISANPYGAGWDAGDIEVRALHAADVFCEYPQSINVAEGVN